MSWSCSNYWSHAACVSLRMRLKFHISQTGTSYQSWERPTTRSSVSFLVTATGKVQKFNRHFYRNFNHSNRRDNNNNNSGRNSQKRSPNWEQNWRTLWGKSGKRWPPLRDQRVVKWRDDKDREGIWTIGVDSALRMDNRGGEPLNFVMGFFLRM